MFIPSYEHLWYRESRCRVLCQTLFMLPVCVFRIIRAVVSLLWCSAFLLGVECISAQRQPNWPPELPLLIEKLEQADTRIATARRIARLGSASLPLLLRRYEAESNDVKRGVLFSFGEMGGEAAQAIPLLIRELENTDRYVRLNAVIALSKLGVVAEEALLNLTLVCDRDSDPAVKKRACQAMDRVSTPSRVVETQVPLQPSPEPTRRSRSQELPLFAIPPEYSQSSGLLPVVYLSEYYIEDTTRSLKKSERAALGYLIVQSYLVSKRKFGQDYLLGRETAIFKLMRHNFSDLPLYLEEGASGVPLKSLARYFLKLPEVKAKMKRR